MRNKKNKTSSLLSTAHQLWEASGFKFLEYFSSSGLYITTTLQGRAITHCASRCGAVKDTDSHSCGTTTDQFYSTGQFVSCHSAALRHSTDHRLEHWIDLKGCQRIFKNLGSASNYEFCFLQHTTWAITTNSAKEKFYSPTAVPFECLSSVWTHKHKIPLIIYIAKGTVKQIKLCHLNNSELICQLHNLSDEAGILEKGRI